jgi:DNA-directed RNA polymerase specialized sigma24 family protein
MRKIISLNGHYDRYSAGLLEKKDFEVLLFNAIREEISDTNLPGWEKGECDDYMSWLYPRISKAIDTYRETGSSFEVYIRTMVRLTIKEYFVRRTRSHVAESVAWNTSVSDMYAFDNEPEYDCTVSEKPGEEKTDRSETVKNPRQLLILVLKCSNYISDDFAEKISSRLGIPHGELSGMINLMREKRAERIKKLELLREKINSLFCRCMVHEKNLSLMTNETAVLQTKKRLERGKNRLAKMRQKLSRLRPNPSNAQIAKLLGISKGTVDASLFYLKKQWNRKNKNNLSEN